MPWQQNVYKDTWVKIIGALFASHFIEAMGRDESIFQMLLRPSYYKALISGFVIAFLTFELISRVTVWLDRRYDWLEKTTPRVLLQLLLAVFLPAALVYLLTFLQMKIIFRQDILQSGYALSELPAAFILIVLANAYYLSYYFYKKATIEKMPAALPGEVTDVHMPIESAGRSKIILVTKGAKTMPLPVEQIAYIYKNGDYAYIKTISQENFLVSYALDELESMLDEKLFFRANRQTLVHWKSCHSFSPAEHGKLQLQLEPQHKEPVIVSQKKAGAFREWLLQYQ